MLRPLFPAEKCLSMPAGDPKAGLYAVASRKITGPCWGTNFGRQALYQVSLVTTHGSIFLLGLHHNQRVWVWPLSVGDCWGYNKLWCTGQGLYITAMATIYSGRIISINAVNGDWWSSDWCSYNSCSSQHLRSIFIMKWNRFSSYNSVGTHTHVCSICKTENTTTLQLKVRDVSYVSNIYVPWCPYPSLEVYVSSLPSTPRSIWVRHSSDCFSLHLLYSIVGQDFMGQMYGLGVSECKRCSTWQH
jgi:hypothetical protein